MSAATAHTNVQSFLVLGTDAVLAARPATPVQLAHACAALGFDVVVPTTWGDELIARALADVVRDSDRPIVQCSCPLVARRFDEPAGVLDGMVARFVPPPIATARYLRAAYARTAVRITYAGDCPVSAGEDLDEHLSCAALFERLALGGVEVAGQPTEFDSVIPPDRRRHYSEPGGLPSSATFRRVAGECDIIEITSGDVSAEVAQHLLAGRHAVLDMAAAVGCRCSGAGDGWEAQDARSRVRAHEPPRSSAPTVDHDIAVSVFAERVSDERVLEPATNLETADAAVQATRRVSLSESALITADPASSRRRSPAVSARAVMGMMPVARSEGRQLPRLYVARRRSSPRGLRQSAVRSEVPNAAAARKRPMPWPVIAVLGIVAGVLITLALAALG